MRHDELSITLAPSISQYFEGFVSDAIRSRRIEASGAATQYLVGLLCEWAHPDDEADSTLRQPLTFLLRDALEASGTERFRRLRVLGDGVLYALGFFGTHIEMRGADRSYVVSVGTAAYDNAATMLRIGTSPASVTDVLSELARKFDAFVGVLGDVADETFAAGARDDGSIVRLYERWLRTGSARLAGELGTRGIVAKRGTGGIC